MFVICDIVKFFLFLERKRREREGGGEIGLFGSPRLRREGMMENDEGERKRERRMSL